MLAHHSLLGLSGPGSDLYDATALLLHCEGADEGTTFVDSSPYAHSVSRVGTTFKTDNAQAKFGATALTGSGSGATDHLAVGDHASLRFGADDFTIDFWLYQNATGGNYGLISKRGSSTNIEFDLNYSTGVGYRIFYSTNGTTLATTIEWPRALDLNAWVHLALVRTGNTLKLFRNGVNLGDKSFSATLFAGTQPLRIGGDGFNARMLAGWLDEIRVSNCARWTSDFTPPIAPYQ